MWCGTLYHMIIRGILWIFSMLVVLALGVAGFVYYAMTNGGLSSDYLTRLITEKITEEVTQRVPDAHIEIGGIEFNLDITRLTIDTRAKDIKITMSDTVHIQFKTVTTDIDIQSLINRKIIIDNMYIADGSIVYKENKSPTIEKKQGGLETVPSTQTDVDTHIKTNQEIANMVSAIGYTVSTQLRGLIDTKASNITVSYKNQDMWAKSILIKRSLAIPTIANTSHIPLRPIHSFLQKSPLILGILPGILMFILPHKKPTP